MSKYTFKIIGIILLLAIFSCKKDDTPVSPAPPIPEDTTQTNNPDTSVEDKENLVGTTLTGEYPKLLMINLAANSDFKDFAQDIYTGIKTFKVEYYTTLNDQQILASGLIHLPDSINESTAILSFQHGTTFKKSDAPSISSSPLALLAGTGYITIEADFIGYGSSSTYTHPYYDRKSSAEAVIDLVFATKQFLKERGIDNNRKLFLAGYSEGGYVTMAALHMIENELPGKNIQVTASAAGAGGYDLNHMLSHITENNTYIYPAYLGLLITGYNVTYNWQKPYTYFFSSPYAEKFPQLVDGSLGGSEVNAQLTEDMEELLNPTFYSDLKNNNNSSEFIQALQLNSIPGWKLNSLLRLYHGDQDDIIPIENSEKFHESLSAQNSSSVTFHTLNGDDHGSGAETMILDFLPWFKSLK